MKTNIILLFFLVVSSTCQDQTTLQNVVGKDEELLTIIPPLLDESEIDEMDEEEITLAPELVGLTLLPIENIAATNETTVEFQVTTTAVTETTERGSLGNEPMTTKSQAEEEEETTTLKLAPEPETAFWSQVFSGQGFSVDLITTEIPETTTTEMPETATTELTTEPNTTDVPETTTTEMPQTTTFELTTEPNTTEMPTEPTTTEKATVECANMKTEGYACHQVVDCQPGTQIENAKCSSFRGAHGRALARLVTATDDRIRVCCKPQLELVYPTPPNLPISNTNINSATVIRISLGVGVGLGLSLLAFVAYVIWRRNRKQKYPLDQPGV